MNPVMLPPQAAAAATSFLATFTVQVTVLLLAAALVLRLFGRHWSAANRHVFLVTTALLVPCLIPATLALQNQGLTWSLVAAEAPRLLPAAPAAGSWKPTPSSSGVMIPGQMSPGNTQPPATRTATTPSVTPQASQPTLAMTILWMSGTCIGAAWLLLGLVQLTWAAWAGRMADTGLQSSLKRQLDLWAPGSRVRLLRGRSGEIPMTWGVFQHFITLPPEAESWTPSALRTVLRHELCHVARRDFLWLTLARACLLLCWFHPLAWWLVRELSRTAEHASDDLATRTVTGRASYARNLVHVVSQCHTGGKLSLASPFRLALAMARSSALRQRVEALMDGNRNRTPYRSRRLVWQLPACVLISTAISTMTACKEKTDAAKTESTKTEAQQQPDETRIYRLSEGQRKLLLGSSKNTRPPSDPFAGPLSESPAPTSDEKQLKAYALNARFHLINRGHVSSRMDHPPQVVMSDTRTLIVTADEQTHNAIAKYLAQNESGEQVLIRSFMLEVEPGWLPWRELGLQEPSKDQLQVQGVLSNDAGQKLMEVIRSDKTVQGLTAAPAVTTRSGQRTHVDMVREFIYPTEFDPPQVLQPPAGADGKVLASQTNLPIMPTTPTAFEMRPVGLRMEYDPVVLPGNIHRIELYWEITEFLGFMNYGTPIKTMAKDRDGKAQELILSENKIQQPVFESLKLTTSFDVPDGGYVVIGGIKPERKSPADLDKSVTFAPAMSSRQKADIANPAGAKPLMYILILQANLVQNPEKK